MSIFVQIPSNRRENQNGNDVSKAQNIVDYTNMKLAHWYKYAKEDYNIDGKGICSYDEAKDQIIIDWVENGERHQYINTYWDNVVGGLDYNYNIWMENPHYQN